jgi:hypothetical protein
MARGRDVSLTMRLRRITALAIDLCREEEKLAGRTSSIHAALADAIKSEIVAILAVLRRRVGED